MDPAGRVKIALALSGGGFRASIFHLGVLRRVAEAGWLDKVDLISTVSGGSIVGAFAILRWNKVIGDGAGWPALKRHVVDPFLQEIQRRNFIFDWALRVLISLPRKTDPTWTRTKLAGDILERWLYEGRKCDELPRRPFLIVNATGLVSIRSWRFTPLGLGDSRYGHAAWESHPLSLGECVAASAAFPPFFPPARILRKDYEFSGPFYDELRLPEKRMIPVTDGGVYDNLGVESLIKSTLLPVKYKPEVSKMLIVSDAGYPPQYQFRESGIPAAREATLLYRVDDIARTQVSALRRRCLVERFKNSNDQLTGSLIYLGSRIKKLPNDGDKEYFKRVGAEFAIPDELIDKIQTIRTHLDRFSSVECEALMYHAYTLADAILWHFRTQFEDAYRVPEIPNPEWRIRFTPGKKAEWESGLKDSHKRRILWPR